MIFEKKDIEITPTNVSAVNHLKEFSKNFVCENDFVQYHKSEGEKRQFICRICSKSCKRKDLLTKHEKIHTERKTQFICKICSKSCKRKDLLTKHEKIHTERKTQFICKICSKSCKRRELLTKHEKIHIGKKSFHCKLCSKSFLKRGNLVVHERLHTGEKPFLCKICCTSFRQLAHLKCHERTHSGENPVVCKFCLKLFANGDHLKDHEKIHSEIPQLVNRFDEDNPNIYEENMEGDLKILEKDIHEVNIKDKPTSKDVDERDITLDEKPSLELIPAILSMKNGLKRYNEEVHKLPLTISKRD
nr:zinc finger protein 420-like isoform X2 [Leptinotarsa decemlineata]